MHQENLINENISLDLKSIILSDRQLCDIELISDGSFAPLKGFLNQMDYNAVLDKMRLDSGELWPIPIYLDLTEADIKKIKNESQIALRNKEGFLIALMDVENIWEADKKREALAVFNTDSLEHPGVYQL